MYNLSEHNIYHIVCVCVRQECSRTSGKFKRERKLKGKERKIFLFLALAFSIFYTYLGLRHKK